VAAVGVCRARFLAEEGRAGEAVDLLLDLSQYVIDLAWEGNLGHGLNALYHHQRFLTELKSLMAAGLLDAAQERQVARELSALDAQLPRFGEGAVIGAMEFSFVVLRTKTVRSLLEEYYMDRSSSVPAWKWGYLDKLTLATLADLQLRTAQRMAAGDAGSWEEARRATIEASAELASSVNPLARQGWATGAKPDWLPLHRMFREYLARHRLLIAAARYRADGILPDLDDPFGSKLRSSRSRQLLKLWSLGGDGLDDGGHGDWSTKGCRDIVLEVRR
jgi:hypothetical protein